MSNGRFQTMWALLSILTLLIVSACGSQGTSQPDGQNEALSVQEILATAADRFESLTSFHFKMSHEGGGTPIALGLEMEEVEGDVVASGRMSATIQAKVRGLFLRVTAISIGDNTYMTNPFTGEFEDFSEVIAPGGFFDPAKGVGAIIQGALDPALVGEENIAGLETYRLRGTVRSEDLKAISGSAVEGQILQAELWVGKDDFLVRKLVLRGRITGEEKEGITRTILVSSFDQPVTIEAPALAAEP